MSSQISSRKVLRLELKISWLQCAVLLLCHLLVLVSTFYVNASGFLQFILCLLVLINLIMEESRALFLLPNSVHQLVIREHDVVLVSQRRKQLAQIKKVRHMSQLLILLEVRVEKQVKSPWFVEQQLLILPVFFDSIPQGQRKDLHGYLNHSFEAASQLLD